MQAEIADTEGGIPSLLLMKDPDTNEPNYRAIIIVYVMPLLTCFSLCFLKCWKKDKKPGENAESQSE